MAKQSHFEINIMDRKPGFYMKGFHSHSWYEIFFLEAGRCEYSIGDTSWTCLPGAIAIVAPNTLHGSSYTGDVTSTRVNIEFSEDFITYFKSDKALAGAFEIMLNGVFQLTPKECAIYRGCLNNLQNEKSAEDAYSKLMCTSSLIQIFTLILRSTKSVAIKDKQVRTDNSLRPALMYIEKNYNKKISLEMLSEMCHLTPTYFSAKFKKLMGTSFKEYLINLRLIQAERLLLETEKSIAEIAFFCGFESGNYFGDAFRKKNNISPSQFRMTKGIHS